MSLGPKLRGFGIYFRTVVLSPGWEFLTTGALFTFLFVATWWRDNFASDEWKKTLDLKSILPHWSSGTWVCAALTLLLVSVLRNGFALWKHQQATLDARSSKAIPEFVIDLEKVDDEVVGFKIKNVSEQNLYEVSVVNIKSRVGEIAWWENFFPCLEARTGERVLKPSSYPSGVARFRDVSTLLLAFQNSPGRENPEHVGDIVILAKDADGDAYRFSTALEIWNSWTWRVWETSRVRHTFRNAGTDSAS